MCARRGCVIQRCQNKNPRYELGPGDMGDVTRWKQGLRFEKKQLVEFLPLNKRVKNQSWARPDKFVCYGRCMLVGLRADDVKAVSIERLSLSPHVEKPLNSKRWIKVSYLNQFRVFGFLYMFMNILWTLCLFHISVSWVCYTGINSSDQVYCDGFSLFFDVIMLYSYYIVRAHPISLWYGNNCIVFDRGH